MTKLYLILLSFVLLPFISNGQEKTMDDNSLQFSRDIEKRFYNESLDPNRLNYNIEPLDDGSFKLIFINQPEGAINIEIYDIIGNLILNEEREYSLNSEIRYNFNETNNKIFVVKVESGDEKMTKKVNF